MSAGAFNLNSRTAPGRKSSGAGIRLEEALQAVQAGYLVGEEAKRRAVIKILGDKNGKK